MRIRFFLAVLSVAMTSSAWALVAAPSNEAAGRADIAVTQRSYSEMNAGSARQINEQSAAEKITALETIRGTRATLKPTIVPIQSPTNSIQSNAWLLISAVLGVLLAGVLLVQWLTRRSMATRAREEFEMRFGPIPVVDIAVEARAEEERKMTESRKPITQFIELVAATLRNEKNLEDEKEASESSQEALAAIVEQISHSETLLELPEHVKSLVESLDTEPVPAPTWKPADETQQPERSTEPIIPPKPEKQS